MKAIQIFLVSLCIFSTIHGQPDNTVFTPDKNQKIKSTFSGTLNQNDSAHFIILEDKTSNNFAIKLFFVKEDKTTTEFDLVVFEKNPTILSHHINNNTVTILTRQTHVTKKKGTGSKSFSNRGKSFVQLTITDFNVETKEITKRNLIRKKKDEDRYIQTPAYTISLQYKEERLLINKITNSHIIDSLQIQPKEEDLQIAQEIFSNYQFVNTEEYVEKGSISDSKGYYHDNILFFSHSNLKKNKIVTTTIDLTKNNTPVFRTTNLPENVTSVATYITNRDLFIFCKNKTDMYIKIHNINTGETMYQATLNNDLFSHFDVDALDRLHRKLSRKANHPTITVNESVDNHMVLRFDYVNTQTYWYHNHMWFHQQMMWNQQMMMQQNTLNNLPGFGPNSTKDNAVLFFKFKSKDLSLKLVLNNEYQPVLDASKETLKKEIDKEKYLNDVRKTYGIKHVSMAFLNDSYRHIQYSPSSNSVTITKAKY